jgi:hypothetical protein
LQCSGRGGARLAYALLDPLMAASALALQFFHTLNFLVGHRKTPFILKTLL